MDGSQKSSCQTCKKEIRRNESSISCANCQQWVHLTCCNLSRKDTRKLDISTFNCTGCINSKQAVKKKSKMTKLGASVVENDSNIPVKEESESDEGEFEEFEDYTKISEISEFELARLENIKRNQEIFDECNIKEAKENLAPKKRRNEIEIVGLSIKREKKEWELLPRRKSLRIQHIQAEVVNKAPKLSYGDTMTEDEYNRKPAEMDITCVNTVAEGCFDSFVKETFNLQKSSNLMDTNDHDNGDLSQYKAKVSSYVVTNIAKLTKDRPYSLAWYPSHTKSILCSGDKKGSVSAWDVDCTSGKDAVFLFDVHARRPVSCLSFSPCDSTKIFSSCYDGTLTCGDFNTLTFTQKFAAEDFGTGINHFAFQRNNGNVVMICTTDGDVMKVDLLSGKVAQTLQLSSKRRKLSARCVDCHPLNEYLIATSTNDGTLATWDLRKITPTECLSSYTAAKTVIKSFFSPMTGNKLLMTSQDNYLRVFDVDKNGSMGAAPRHPIKHENYYGRWLTTFRAAWDPKTDHSFVCGSMAQPRQLDVYGCDEKARKLVSYTLMSESLSFISSINVFHPQKDLLASTNSTGRTIVWSIPS